MAEPLETMENTLRLGCDAPEVLSNLGPRVISGVPLVRVIDGDPFRLEDHQRRVLRRLYAGSDHVHGTRGTLLAAAMGAGKTAIALIYALSTTRRDTTSIPPLVVCSRTLLDMWKSEGIGKFLDPCAGVRVLYLHAAYVTKAFIESLDRATLSEYDLVITTYEFVMGASKATNAFDDIRIMGRAGVWGESLNKLRHIEKRTRAQADDAAVVGRGILFKSLWPLIVVDEPQRFANYKTATFLAMMSLFAEDHLCLSGTPTRNYDTDIWSIFRWMGYNRVKAPRGRRNRWSLSLLVECDPTCETQKCLRDLIVRVTSADMSPLPPITYHTVLVPLGVPDNPDDMTEQVHIAYLLETMQAISTAKASREAAWVSDLMSKVLAAFSYLRRVSVAPCLVLPEALRTYKPDDPPRGGMAPANVLTQEQLAWCRTSRRGPAGTESAKATALCELVARLPPGEKILVFACFTCTIDLLAEALEVHGIASHKLDGDVKACKRLAIRQAFHVDDVRVMFLSYPVAAEGINLTCATHVALFEVWWNQAVMDQAIARSWRRGQTKPVQVWQLVSTKSIEPSILKLCEHKKRLSEAVLGDLDLKKFEIAPRISLNLATIEQIVEQALGAATGGGGGGGGAPAQAQ